MKDKEILEKAVSKAIENGWNYFGNYNFLKIDWWLDNEAYGAIIFNKRFAKALWGEEVYYCIGCNRHHETLSDCDSGTGNNQSKWHYHLQNMVISENPIKYLEENI